MPRKEWPKAREVMQHRRPTFEEEGRIADKKFDLRDGKIEVWLFVASAVFGAFFSLILFQLVRLLSYKQSILRVWGKQDKLRIL